MMLMALAPPAVAQTDAPPLDDAIAPFVIANVEFTLVHELMHVLIDEAGVPVLAREEDQADYMTAITLLSQKTGFPEPAPATAPARLTDRTAESGPLAADVIARMQAIIDAWRVEWTIAEQDKAGMPFADPHAMEIQRLYDMACLTYGRDPGRLKDFPVENELPLERAELCPEDFAKAERGVEFIKTTLRNDSLAAVSGNVAKSDFEIRLVFEPAISPAHQQYKTWLENASISAALIDLINADYFLPRPVTVQFRICGQPNANWEPKNAEVSMCYELLDRFVHLARFRQEYAIERRKTVLGMAKANAAFD